MVQRVVAMGNSFVMMVDSGTDLPHEYYEKNDLRLIEMNFVLNGVEYKDDAGLSMDYKKFYDIIRNGGVSSTSMINVDKYTQEFEKVLAGGEDLLYISMSSGISGSYNSARLAAEELSEKYPNRKLRVCDGLIASMGGALLTHLALKERAKGKSIDEVAQWVEDNKLYLNHLFTVDDLMYLQRGGRISKTVAVMGSLIGVKPMLDVDDKGALRQCHKKRGRRGALDGLVEWMEQLTETRDLEAIAISHGDCQADAEYVLSRIKEKYKVGEVLMNFIGPVIGTHSGPGTVALFFMGKHRT